MITKVLTGTQGFYHMRKFAVAFGAAVSALAVTAPASAATFVLNVDQPTDSVHFGNSTNKYKYFYDFFNFDLPKQGIVDINISSFANRPWLDVVLTKVTLDGNLLTRLASGPHEIWSGKDIFLGEGSHQLFVYGRSGSRGGTYAGDLNYTAVPEPAAWAMMISGFGFVGAMMRRRRTKLSVRYA